MGQLDERRQLREREKIPVAVEILRGGGVVAFPTETVYGLGADAREVEGVQKVFELKGRPARHPLIVHIASSAELPQWAASVPPLALLLAQRYWPGPLTLVLHRARGVLDSVTGGQDTLALRVPAHPLALELLLALESGIAAPSANRHGRVSPTSAEHVRAEFGDEVPLILDGGPCALGIESTILDLSGERPRLLRPGMISREELEEVCGPLEGAAGGSVRAPGSLPAHYAPRARVQLSDVEGWRACVLAHLAAGRRVAAWVMRKDARPPPAGVLEVELPLDPARAAHELYARLHELDDLDCDVLVVVPPEERGVGAALADRLKRAAGKG